MATFREHTSCKPCVNEMIRITYPTGIRCIRFFYCCLTYFNKNLQTTSSIIFVYFVIYNYFTAVFHACILYITAKTLKPTKKMGWMCAHPMPAQCAQKDALMLASPALRSPVPSSWQTFQLAPKASMRSKDLCVLQWVERGGLSVPMCTCRIKPVLEEEGNTLTVSFPRCQDQSVFGKLMENTKPI